MIGFSSVTFSSGNRLKVLSPTEHLIHLFNENNRWLESGNFGEYLSGFKEIGLSFENRKILKQKLLKDLLLAQSNNEGIDPSELIFLSSREGVVNVYIDPNLSQTEATFEIKGEEIHANVQGEKRVISVKNVQEIAQAKQENHTKLLSFLINLIVPSAMAADHRGSSKAGNIAHLVVVAAVAIVVIIGVSAILRKKKKKASTASTQKTKLVSSTINVKESPSMERGDDLIVKRNDRFQDSELNFDRGRSSAAQKLENQGLVFESAADKCYSGSC